MYLCRCVHFVSLTEYSITIQVVDKLGGLLALDKLSTSQGRHYAIAPPIAPPAAPTSLHQYT